MLPDRVGRDTRGKRIAAGEKIPSLGRPGASAFPLARTPPPTTMVWGIERFRATCGALKRRRIGCDHTIRSTRQRALSSLPTDFTYRLPLAADFAVLYRRAAGQRGAATGPAARTGAGRPGPHSCIASTITTSKKPHSRALATRSRGRPWRRRRAPVSAPTSVSKRAARPWPRYCAGHSTPLWDRTHGRRLPSTAVASPAMPLDAIAAGDPFTTRWDPMP